MQDIIIIRQSLSQYHAGQAIEHSAHCVRDHDGDWFSVIGTNDRSTLEGWQYEVRQHRTRREADQAVMDRLVVSCDRTIQVDMSDAHRVVRRIEKDVHIHVHLDVRTLRATWTVVRETGECDVQDLPQQLLRAIRAADLPKKAREKVDAI